MSVWRNAVWFCNGYMHYTRGGYGRASASFDPRALDVSLAGKVAVVTGANSGIGRETALELARRGATVHLLCRDQAKGQQTIDELVRGGIADGALHLQVVDMSRPAHVQAFAQRFKAAHDRLDVLVNNAGCMVRERRLTADGLETNFATNALGVFVLTEALMEPLERAGGAGRVVTVTSGGMLVQKLDARDPQCGAMRPFDATMAYAQNKRVQVELTDWWARHHPTVRFYSAHPGWADTPAVRDSMPDFYTRFKGVLRTAQQGADTIVWAAVSEQAKEHPSGSFLQDRRAVAKHLPLAQTRATEGEVETLVQGLRKILAESQ